MKRFIQTKMKFISLLIIIFISVIQNNYYAQTDPDFEWVKNLGGSLTDDIKDIITDADGNIIVTGSFDTFMSIGTINLVSTGGYDFFLAKFDSEGNVLWATNAGSPNYDVGFSVTIDNTGDILVTGIYNGDAMFGTIPLPARGGYDIFIARYSTGGAILWADRAGGQGFEFVNKIDTDNLNNIYITGQYDQLAIFDTITVQANQNPNVYIAKYNSAGDVQWVRTGLSNSFYTASNGLAVSNDNEIYITGTFESSINFSGTVLTGQQGGDIFLTKYNTEGTLAWAIQASGLSFNDEARDVFVDDDDNVYVTGSFGQTVNFGNNTLTSVAQSDIFVAKYNFAGDPIWALQDAVGLAFNNWGVGLTVDSAGNVALISEVSQVGTGEVNDLYVSRYNSDGQKIWGYTIGSQSSDYAGRSALTNEGDILVCGRFYESGIFGTKNLLSNGFHDGFFGKIPVPNFVVTNSLIDFGIVPVGGSSNIDLIITNPKNTTLHFYNSLVGGTDASLFSFDPTPTTIAPLQSQTISVGFSPLTSGTKSAHLIFETDAPTSADTVFLTGSAGIVSISLSTSLLEFGSVDTSDTAERTVTVSNTGSEPAIILLPLILGLNQSDFSVNNIQSFPDTLQPQETKNITITFSPGSIGIRSAQLQIISNAQSSPDLVSLEGTGVVELPAITLSSSLLDFGTVDTDNFSIRTLTITNTGSLDIVIDSATMLPATQTDFSVLNFSFPFTLLPDEVLNLSIRFAPVTPGDKAVQLRIFSNAISSPDLVDLEGNAVTGIIVQLPPAPQLGQTISLNISPPSGFEATGGEIFYRQTGDQNYTSAVLTQQDTSFPADIPPQFATIKGVQFYIIFTGSTGTVTYPTTNPINQPAVLQVNVPVFPFQGTIPNAEYRMVSIPMSVNTPEILSVLGDDYGQYDSTMWRIFRWNQSIVGYDEFPEGGFIPGNAFWLIHKEGKPFDIEDALSVQSSSDFIITLQANSWTQIGNPFAFPVEWSLIGSSLLVDPPIRWNPDSLDYELNQLILEPWDGYWVRNPLNQVVTLTVPPISFIEENILPKESFDFQSGEFVLQIRSNLDDNKIRDNQNFVGMVNEQNIIYSRNISEPPPIQNDLRLSIMEDGNLYAQNTVRVNSDGAIWNLKLRTSRHNENVYLTFDRKNNLPAGFNIYLLDLDRQVTIPVKGDKSVFFMNDQEVFNFKLVIGTEQFAKNNSENISLTPTDYILSQNYPNPFNPSTSIVYNLKEKSVVTIEVFDLLGRKIRSLVNNEQQNSGLHTAVWNGFNTNGDYVSSGIYIYRIKANDFIDSKKMMLLK